MDDGSTDKTAEKVMETFRHGRVQLITQPNGGKSRALNHGIEAATACKSTATLTGCGEEYILYIDADCTLSQDFIRNLTS